MAKNPPEGVQRVIPYLLVKDPGATMDLFCKAFGFEERERMEGPGGMVVHGEVGLHDNVVMLGGKRPGYEDYKAMIYCYVDDVDAHHAAAVAGGATVTQELTDQFYGDRSYACKDDEGNEFHFATHVKTLTREELEAAAEAAFAGGEA